MSKLQNDCSRVSEAVSRQTYEHGRQRMLGKQGTRLKVFKEYEAR